MMMMHMQPGFEQLPDMDFLMGLSVHQQQQQQHQHQQYRLQAAPTAVNKRGVPKQRGANRCQVPGCCADLTAQPKAYCLKKRICMQHMQADELLWPGVGQRMRYCFQCARVEPLDSFEGKHRSCRASLSRRKVRPASSTPRQTTPEAPAASAAAAATVMQLQQQGSSSWTAGPLQGMAPHAMCLDPSLGWFASASADDLTATDVWSRDAWRCSRSASPADIMLPAGASLAAAVAAGAPNSLALQHQLQWQQAQQQALQPHPRAAPGSPGNDRESEAASSASPPLHGAQARAATAEPAVLQHQQQPAHASGADPTPGQHPGHQLAIAGRSASAPLPAAGHHASSDDALFGLLTQVLEGPLSQQAPAGNTAAAAAASPPAAAAAAAAASPPSTPACSAAPVASGPAPGLRGSALLPGGPLCGARLTGDMDLHQTAAQLQALERELTSMYSHLQALRQAVRMEGGRAAA